MLKTIQIRIFTFSLLVLFTANAYSSLKGTRPNIVLIMPDDISYGAISAYGGTASPHVDQLYHLGFRFEDFHVSPTCSPTRAAMLTGRHECYGGVTHTINMRDRLNPELRTIADMLKDAGYATGIFGKWHLGDSEAFRPDQRGFDEVYIHGAGGIGQNYPHSADYPNNDYNNPTLYHNGKSIKTKGYCTDLFFDRGIEWIKEQQKAENPFFCYLPLNVNHGPFIPPLLPDGSHAPKSEIMKNLDDNVGKMTAFLESSGLLENTLYIYVMDNGAKSGDKKLKGSKGSAYEGGTRVPCILYWKGKIDGGVDCHELVGHIDFYATFAELVGSEDSAPGKKDWDGRSLLPLLENPQTDWPERYWVSHKTRWKNKESGKYAMGAIRDSRWKIVFPKGPEPELYDLDTDLQEKHNIAEQHPDVVERLKAQYEAWWTDIQPYLVNDDLPNIPQAHKPYHELYRRDFGEEAFLPAMTAMDWDGEKPFGKKKKK